MVDRNLRGPTGPGKGANRLVEEPQRVGGGWMIRTSDGLSAWGLTVEDATKMLTIMRRHRQTWDADD